MKKSYLAGTALFAFVTLLSAQGNAESLKFDIQNINGADCTVNITEKTGTFNGNSSGDKYVKNNAVAQATLTTSTCTSIVIAARCGGSSAGYAYGQCKGGQIKILPGAPALVQFTPK